MRDLYNIISKEVSSIKSFKSKHTNLTMTANFPDLTHYDANLKTSNCFMIAHNDKKYLVSTTHTIMDSWKSTDSVIASSIRCMKTKLTDYVYSRFFDVVIFDVTDNDKFKNVVPIDKFNMGKATSANVSFMDVNSDVETSVFVKYMNNISSSMEMDAVSHHLPAGSSGCAVVDTANNLLGMITSMGENYENMTLVVPAKTILGIIETADFSKSDYDSYASNYPKIISTPLQRGHLEYLSVDKGEFVVVSDDTTIVKPFDIITKVNNTHNRLATEAHLKDKVMVDIMRLKPEWRKIYGALPRNVPIYNDSGEKHIEETKYLELGKKEFSFNGNKLNVKGNVKLEYIYPGMNIKFYNGEYWKISFATITHVDKSKNIVTINKEINSDVKAVYFYYLSSIYSEQANDDVPGIEYFNWSTVASNNMTNEEYKFYCQYVNIKHWAFLVLSSISSLPVGHQQIVWANETLRLLKLLNNYSDELEILCSIILFKLMEFNEIQALNLFVIFVKNVIDWFELTDNDVIKLEKNLTENISLLSKMEFISTSFKEAILNNGKKITEGYDGNTLYNADMYSNEKYNLQNTVAKAKMRIINRDNINIEIELVLEELNKLNTKNFNNEEYYYPSSFGLLKSFWDHAHLTLGGIMETLTDDMFEKVSDVKLPLGVLPSYMSTWGFTSVLSRGHDGGSWICTYLHKRGMLTDSEYKKFNKFGLYAFKHHSSTMQGYWSYLEQLMEHFSNIASEEEWNHFKPWIVETIQMIDSGKMEDAYDNFCKKVIYLTENYNTNYFLFDNKQKDIYSGIYQKYVICEAIKQ